MGLGKRNIIFTYPGKQLVFSDGWNDDFQPFPIM